MPSSSNWWIVMARRLKTMSSDQELAKLSAIFALKKLSGKESIRPQNQSEPWQQTEDQSSQQTLGSAFAEEG